MVWLSTAAQWWLRKAKRRKSTLTLSLSAQSTRHSICVTTSFIQRYCQWVTGWVDTFSLLLMSQWVRLKCDVVIAQCFLLSMDCCSLGIYRISSSSCQLNIWPPFTVQFRLLTVKKLDSFTYHFVDYLVYWLLCSMLDSNQDITSSDMKLISHTHRSLDVQVKLVLSQCSQTV